MPCDYTERVWSVAQKELDAAFLVLKGAMTVTVAQAIQNERERCWRAVVNAMNDRQPHSENKLLSAIADRIKTGEAVGEIKVKKARKQVLGIR